MKLGILTAPYAERPLADLLPELAGLGVEAVELGTGNYPGDAHARLDVLLDDRRAQKALLDLVDENGMIISALSQHGNPLHPRREVARAAHETWRKTVQLAELLGVGVVNAFSGCPGDSDRASYPNWVTCSWPTEYLEVRDWQWREKVEPYWRTESAFAAKHHVKIAIEMHAGFVVYNPTTLLELRDLAGEHIGANLDPSHLFWQGIDPIETVGLLASEGALFHVHAKDTEMAEAVVRTKGVLDLAPHEVPDLRSWAFRTVGLGHDLAFWQAFVDALAAADYDYVVSIEHEDERLDRELAIPGALALLREALGRIGAHRPAAGGMGNPAVVGDVALDVSRSGA
jgi:sugar phosphate isomerase/epimerase